MGTALVAGKRQRQKFSAAIQTDAYQSMIKRTLQDPDREKRFVASITSAVAVNPQLQECTASSILAGALLGESLGLSPSPQLGQYYLVPFKNQLKDENGNKLWLTDENGNKLKDEKGKWIPVTEMAAVFVCGYKGFVQMALKTGQYRKINVIEIKEGELRHFDPLNEEIECILIDDFDKREAAPTIGYYAMFEYLNGFRKAVYWSKEKMLSHADKYSPAFKKTDYARYISGDYDKKEEYKFSSFWYKDFDAMAKKTMIRQLLTHWGILSTELQEVIIRDEKMTQLVNNEIVTADIDVLPEPIGQVSVEDMKPEFTEVSEKVNLEDL